MSIKLKTLLDNCNILSLIITNSIMSSTLLLCWVMKFWQ